MGPYALRGIGISVIISVEACTWRMFLEFHLVDFVFFSSPMLAFPKTAEKVVLESCVLHSFLRANIPSTYTHCDSFDNVDIEIKTV